MQSAFGQTKVAALAHQCGFERIGEAGPGRLLNSRLFHAISVREHSGVAARFRVMRKKQRSIAAVAVLLLAGITPCAGQQQAQPGRDIPVPQETTCPPGTSGGPTIGSNQSGETLSDQLAQSKGVICPPAGVDAEIKVPPPGGGRTPVITPPGTPGGNPSVIPK
jgi:hypothetical protein